jgi:hypothetical protein
MSEFPDKVIVAPVLFASSLPRASQLQRILPLTSRPCTVVTSVNPNEEEANLFVHHKIQVVKFGKLSKILSKVMARVLGRVTPWVDEYIFWNLKVALLLAWRPSSIKAIVTCGQPHSVTLIGVFLSLVNRNCKWFLYMSDPLYSFSHFKPDLVKTINQSIEQLSFNRSHKVIVTNPNFCKMLVRAFGSDNKDKFDVLLHAMGKERNSISTRRSSRLRIMHAGSLYGKRSVDFLLEALDAIGQNPSIHPLQMEFVFVGNMEKDLEVDLLSFKSFDIKVHNRRLSRDTIEDLCCNVDVLMTIEGQYQQNPYFPSKIVDYLAFDKHQLILSNEGYAVSFFSGQPGFSVVEASDPAKIRRAILSIYAKWSSQRLDVPTRSTRECFSLQSAKRSLRRMGL